jgi:hypothetical protein
VVSPTSGSLEAMVFQEERDEYLANTRRMNNNASTRTPSSNEVVVQVPDQKEMPGYVPSNGVTSAALKPVETPETATPDTDTTNTTGVTTNAEMVSANTSNKVEATPAINLRPIETSVRTLDITKTADTANNSGDSPVGPVAMKKMSLVESAASGTNPQAEFAFGAELTEMAKGQKIVVPVLIKSAAPFRQTVLALKYDDQKVAIRSVTYGDIFGTDQSKSIANPYLNKGGKTFISLNAISPVTGSGILAYVEIEALADGKPQITFDAEAMNMLSSGGAFFSLNFK